MIRQLFLLAFLVPLFCSCQSKWVRYAYLDTDPDEETNHCLSVDLKALSEAKKNKGKSGTWIPLGIDGGAPAPMGADHLDVSKAVIVYSTFLKHDKHLHLQDGCLIDEAPGPVLHLEYISQDNLELGQARDLLVDTVEGLLDALAKETDFPATAMNLDLYIDFESYQGRYVDPYYVGYIWLENGIAHFYAFDTKDNELDFWHSRTESYYKSVKFVEYHREGEALYEQAHKPAAVRALAEEQLFLEKK